MAPLAADKTLDMPASHPVPSIAMPPAPKPPASPKPKKASRRVEGLAVAASAVAVIVALISLVSWAAGTDRANAEARRLEDDRRDRETVEVIVDQRMRALLEVVEAQHLTIYQLRHENLEIEERLGRLERLTFETYNRRSE